MPNDVIPRTEDGRKSWAENIILKFDPLYVSLGFTRDERDAFFNDLNMVVYLITSTQSAVAESKARNAHKKQMFNGLNGGTALALPLNTQPEVPANLVEPGMIGRIRKMIGRIKLAPNYTEAIGEQLRINGDDTEREDPANGKPSFTATAQFIGVLLEWIKGNFDGVVIECQRGAETTYVFLDKDSKSPFVDMRPNLVAGQPEKRRYRMIYLLDDQIVGQYSDEVVVTTIA